MGYDLHITRRQDWFDSGGLEISIEEWLALLDSDPELRLDGYAEALLPDGTVLRVEDPSMAVWVAYSRHMLSGNMAWLWHSRGNIMAKNPDEEIRRKMWRLAQTLSAKLQGDESESYDRDGLSIEAVDAKLQSERKTWWRLW